MTKSILKISLPLIIIDQITKWWIVFNLKQPYIFTEDGQKHYIPDPDTIPVIDNFLNIVRVHNQGVAFGLGNGSNWAPIVFLIVPFIALVLIKIMWGKKFFVGISKYSAPLLVAGIIGNLIDRLFQGFWLKGPIEHMGFWKRLSEGYVVDFIDCYFSFQIPFTGSNHWPSFNVADSCICIAAALLFISSFSSEHHQPKSN